MSVDVSIPQIYSPKRCGMEHTFDGCEILSCVVSPTFCSSHCWSSIISHSRPHTQIIVRWYLPQRLRMRFQHKILISKLCVPFPCVVRSQISPICRALAVSSSGVFITLFHLDCFECSLLCRFLFPNMIELNSPRLVAFPAFSFWLLCHGRKGGGCCHVSSPRGTSTSTACWHVPWSSLVLA